MSHEAGTKPNAQYNVAKPESVAMRVTAMMRRKMYEAFVATVRPLEHETLLDVGVTSDRVYASSNYLEAWYPHKHRITAAGVDDARHLEDMYPGIRYVHADGKALPFDDNSFDVVHSSAVIEHVGSRFEQGRLISELYRVARRAMCITTPNRWFPVEVHTGVPLLHWLPPSFYRGVIRRLGLAFFADEDNLNLMGRADLLAICREQGVDEATLQGMKLFGWTSNLVLFAQKGSSATTRPRVDR